MTMTVMKVKYEVMVANHVMDGSSRRPGNLHNTQHTLKSNNNKHGTEQHRTERNRTEQNRTAAKAKERKRKESQRDERERGPAGRDRYNKRALEILLRGQEPGILPSKQEATNW